MAYNYFGQFRIHKSFWICIKHCQHLQNLCLLLFSLFNTVLELLEGPTSKTYLKTECMQGLW